jgi:hypothetical protein
VDSHPTRIGYSMENFRVDVGNVNKDIKTTIKMEQGWSFMAVIALCMIGVWMNSPMWVLVTFTMGSTYLVIRGKRKGWKWPKRP